MYAERKYRENSQNTSLCTFSNVIYRKFDNTRVSWFICWTYIYYYVEF